MEEFYSYACAPDACHDYVESNFIDCPTSTARHILLTQVYVPQDKYHFMMQIHDEIVIEVQQEKARQGCDMLRESMEGAWQLHVPLEVQLRIGPSWGELQLLNADP